MKNLEGNKIFASVILAALIAMVCGKVTQILYSPKEANQRGYQIEVPDEPKSGAVKKEVVIDIPALMAIADVTSGEKTFKKCAACHGVNEGGSHKVGPNLYAVMGSDIAKKSGYAYSDALSNHGGKWDYKNMYKFLNKPKKFAPGTKMSFIGLRKPQQIADMMAYLRQNGSQSLPLPKVEKKSPEEAKSDNSEG